MSAKRTKDGSGEVRLEGAGLVVVGGVILAAIVGAFFLGAWVERRAHPPADVAGAEAALDDPLAPLELDVEPRAAEEGMDFFDRVDEERAPAEPARQVAPAEPVDRGAPTASARRDEPRSAPAVATETTAAGGAGADGPFWAQVFAGRDERAATRLAGELESSGYPVQVAAVRQGQSTLYKVRVGGYSDEERARSVARELVKQGYTGAWVTRVDD